MEWNEFERKKTLHKQILIHTGNDHLQQSLWRKVQEQGKIAIANYKQENHPFNNLVTAIGGVAFVPGELVPDAFQKICQKFNDGSKEYTAFSEYFYQNYIGVEQG